MQRFRPTHLLLVVCAFSACTANGQSAVLTILDQGGTVASSATYRLVTVVGQPLVGAAESASERGRFGIWFGEYALAASAVSNDPNGLPEGVPEELTLAPNYPNPTSHQTTLRFGVPAESEIRIAVFDILGRIVRVAVDDRRPAGWHEIQFATSNLPSGVYFVRLESGRKSRVRSITVAH